LTTPRIAIGGIATESCTFSTLPTRLEGFSIARGQNLLPRYPFLSKFADVEFVPIVQASAIPGGPVESLAYAEIKAELLDQLRAGGPWDGIYLDMHGAMNVLGMDDAEGDWISAVRQVVGKDCLISASYDLHGNVSRRIIDNLDLLTAFRTAPHVDYEETRERAVTLLLYCLRNAIRPHMTFVPVPVVLPGERTSTEWEPGASLYARIPEIAEMDGILDASILVGYVWADEPRSTASVVVVGTDHKAVETQAVRLAQGYWDARHDFEFGVPVGGVDEIIQMALAAPESCVFISDSGDNPTAGGVGDVPYFLERLIAAEVLNAVYASIPDAHAIDICHAAHVGAEVELSLGGKLDPVHGAPLAVRGRVLTLEIVNRVGHFRTAEDQINKHAVIQVDGVKVILTQHRTPFHYIADFQRLGIEPTEHKIVVVKVGYLVPDLKKAAPKALLALSPGAVDQAITRLPYRRIGRPIYPLDADMRWEPTAENPRDFN
jgi:microcystin degradation protein MlrC